MHRFHTIKIYRVSAQCDHTSPKAALKLKAAPHDDSSKILFFFTCLTA
ncbi:MAG: hypothetical protein AAF443_07740 [Chlamydiota bacterium]